MADLLLSTGDANSTAVTAAMPTSRPGVGAKTIAPLTNMNVNSDSLASSSRGDRDRCELGSSPPPADVRQPERHEEIVDEDASAPAPAQDRGGLLRGAGHRRLVIPPVDEVEGEDDVRERECETGRGARAREPVGGRQPPHQDFGGRPANCRENRAQPQLSGTNASPLFGFIGMTSCLPPAS